MRVIASYCRTGLNGSVGLENAVLSCLLQATGEPFAYF
jgi:hypothetical protein